MTGLHLTGSFAGIGDPPFITSFQALSDSSIRVFYSQYMSSSLANFSAYSVSANPGNKGLSVISASAPISNPQYVDLYFNNEMTNGTSNYVLNVSSSVRSIYGDSVVPSTSSFSGYGISPYLDNVYIPTSLNGSSADNISFSILDSTSGILSGTISVSIKQGTGSFEPAIYSGTFIAPFNGVSSSITPISNGFQVVINPLSFEILLNISAQDSSFNLFSGSTRACDDAVIIPNKIVEIPEMETLVLNWDFNNVTGSGPSSDGLATTSDAKFIVEDLSSGSLDLTSRYYWMGPIRYHQDPGQGDFFLPNDSNVIQKEFVPSAKQMLPEVLNSSNLVEIRTEDDTLFTRETRPIKHFYAIEKSLYGIISEEIMKVFSTTKSFNNLIGEPVNRYRQKYKDLEKLRSLYFERSKNSTIDLEKFIDYFKWFDSSISKILEQLVPGSANFSSDIRNVIESHILERNKYWTKFPTLELKQKDPEGGLKGINELLYDYQSGSAPLPLIQTKNNLWWKNRAERTGVNSSGRSDVDNSRTLILSASLTAFNRALTTPLRLSVDTLNSISGGIDSNKNNLKNIKNDKSLYFISSSVRDAHIPLGNYSKDYEIIQTSGRTKNNRFLKKSNGTASFNLTSPINGYPDFRLNDRSASVNDYIFAERFSSPGESRTMSRGKLEQLGEEYSVYNNVNFRNLSIREYYKNIQSLHAGQFGVNPTSSIVPNSHKVNRNTSRRIEMSGNIFVTASNYDNEFVQRPIPQSELQYQWITSSIDSINNRVYGYESDFMIPSGETSLEAIDLTFISASQVITSNNIPVDFIGLNTLINDTILTSSNMLSSSNDYRNINFGTINSADVLNSLLNHRNGPYSYPSWKQTRTGEHPVSRYQKNKNILSILNPPIERVFLTPSGDRIVYRDVRPDSFKNYIEPPVSFKFKPLIHTMDVTGSSLPVSLRHSYSNNLSLFSNVEINNSLDLKKCNSQLYDQLKSLYLATDLDSSQNPVQGFIQMSYEETIFPKEKNTGLGKVRGRLNFAEDANLSASLLYNFYDGNQSQVLGFTASGSYGDNGIDRNPLQRRTFWRKQAYDRNRFSLLSASNTINDFLLSSVKTPLINSLGEYDGKSTSIFPFGVGLGHTQSAEGTNDTSRFMQIYNSYDFGELAQFRNIIGVGYPNGGGDGNGGNAGWGGRNDYTYWQNGNDVNFGSASAGYYFLNPTASISYNKPDFGIFGAYYAENINNSGTGSNAEFAFPIFQDDFGHRFRTPIFAGKDPWFDSYEDYSQDIRYLGKDYSIVPEFNMSKNMTYYVLKQGGNFKKQNDKFLLNAGASITQSANNETDGFNEDFFTTYAHSDVMRHLDNFVNEHDNLDIGINKIKLTCKGIKKLLPFNGFYPVTRTVQLATLFSQSYAPFIGGYKWQNGKPTDTASYNGGTPSGTLAVASLLQPFFAPGILFNTIKSGIAMDFAVFTGSAANTGQSGIGASTVALSNPPNYRLQFESLLDLKNGSGMGGIPLSSSDGSKKVFWQGPEYMFADVAVTPSSRRDLFFDWNGGETSPLYRMAMHNFLAETVNFFLQDNSLKTIKSRPSNRIKSMASGNTYYMDVRLNRSSDLLMYGGKWNNVRKLFHSGTILGNDAVNTVPDYAALTYTGKFFGHPFNWINTASWGGPYNPAVGDSGTTSVTSRPIIYADGGYAPYLPPYFYNDSVARISYVADGSEKNQTDPISYILSKVKVENKNDSLLDLLTFYNTGSTSVAMNLASWQGRTTISSSVNLFGVTKGLKTTYDPKNIDPETGRALPLSVDEADASFNSWVISPKFECPIMNFINQPDEYYKVIHNDGDSRGGTSRGPSPISGSAFPIPKGMWSGYGEFCTGSTGVFLSIGESFPDLSPNARVLTGSLVDVFGFETSQQRLGEVAHSKEISEAIVAIPFVENQSIQDGFAKTTKVIGRNFIEISSDVFNKQKNRKNAGQSIVNAGEYGSNGNIDSTSITKLIEQMGQYVIPPELNFLKYPDIQPFVMYIFEFKHNLDQQDLADIWQGVMPKIAMTAEKDEIEITHEMRPWEFFEGKKLPPNIRWMIFKVKKQASINYFEKTADAKDDSRFKFDFEIGTKAPEYSFNWPYDYCSLVELAKIETEVDITPLPKNIVGVKPLPAPGISETIKTNLTPIASPTATPVPTIGTAIEKNIKQLISSTPLKQFNIFGK